MSYKLIIVRSLTYAQRAERLLERSGIYSSVKKAPQSATTNGCAYGVLVKEKNLAEARKILESNSIKIQSVTDYDVRRGTK